MNLKQRKDKITKQLENWAIQKEILIQEQDLKEQKKKIKNRGKEQRKKLSMSKRLTLFLFINCTIIQLFTLYITYKSFETGMGDLSALHILITAVVAEVIAFAIYSLKSLKQNTAGGIVYETALLDYGKQQSEYCQNLQNDDLKGDENDDELFS